MRFQVKKDVLLDSILNVSRAISTKTPILALQGILFEVTNDGLYLTGSNTEYSIKTFIPKSEDLQIEKTGSIVIQSRYIVEIVRKTNDEFINFEIVDGFLIKIISSNSEVNLNGINPKEYQKIDFDLKGKPITFTAKEFKTIVEQTTFATSLSENRPLLTGVNFRINGKLLECTATDSYRLSRKRVKLEETIDKSINIVIPSKSLNELAKLFIEDEEKLEMYVFGTKVIFKYGTTLLNSRLLEGTYPDTSKLIPEKFEKVYVVNTQEIFDATDRASLLSSDHVNNIVNLEVKGSKGYLTSNTPEVGRIEEKFSVDNKNNENIKVSFNARYFMDALKALNSLETEISINDEVSPFIIRNVHDDTIVQLILPVRTY